MYSVSLSRNETTSLSRPLLAFSASSKKGLRRNRTSKTRSASSGIPYLNPKETSDICSDGLSLVWANSSLRKLRSSWALKRVVRQAAV